MKDLVKWFALLRFVYPLFLRPLIVKAVDDPNETWDDTLLEIIDRLFNYKQD